MFTAVIITQGLFEIVGLGSFIYGYFADIELLMIIGGVLIVIDDVIDVFAGILKPLFPAVIAIVLAFVFTPWYIGIFWASAVFKVLGIPVSIKKVLMPKQHARKIFPENE